MNTALLTRLVRVAGITRLAPAAGAICWVVALAAFRPGPFAVEWARLLLLLAPLVLVPLGLRLLAVGLLGRANLFLRLAGINQLPAALLLGYAFQREPGLAAGLVSLPWLVVTVVLALTGLACLRQRRPEWSEAGLDAALLFVPVGAAWALADRLGLRPLNFDPDIVLLTAIHFHYAGFALPLCAGLAGQRLPGLLARVTGALIVAGVPLTAVGITATQLRAGGGLECAAAWVMAAGGLLAGALHLRLAARREGGSWPRVLWAVAGVALLFSMALAALYGARFYWPIAWLDLPWMRALHGTANALGFGLAGLLGWALAGRHHG
jgi:hypothetical protein